MARSRVINPRLLDSPLIEKLGGTGAFFWVGIILLCDDEGRVRGDSIYLKRAILGGCAPKTTLDQVAHWLRILPLMGAAYTYDGPNGGQFLQVANWSKYQKISHKSPSKIPPPREDQIPECFRSVSGAIPDQEERGRRGVEGGCPLSEGEPPTPRPQKKGSASPAPTGPRPALEERPGPSGASGGEEKPRILPDGWDTWTIERKLAHFAPGDWGRPAPDAPLSMNAEQRRAHLKAQAEAIGVISTPEQLAEIEARLAAGDGKR